MTLSPRERVPEGRVRGLNFAKGTKPPRLESQSTLSSDAGPGRKGNTLDHPHIHTREPCLTKPTD
jgi:hypothetical protein